MSEGQVRVSRAFGRAHKSRPCVHGRKRTCMGKAVGAALAVIAIAAWAPHAAADATHVVARGHTMESIANRYRVPVKTIVEANKLKNPNRLKPGDTLVIPGVKDVGSKASTKDGKESPAGLRAKIESKPEPKKTKPPTYAMRPKAPGLLTLSRLSTSEEAKVRAVDRKGRTAPVAMKTMEKLLRSASGQSKPVNPRLVALVTIVSDHFGGRKIEVISGYRPYSPAQHTAHSNHNVGSAMDFRVVGVPNEIVRDYCKTLRNVGVGYYPNSTFVHLDVRSTPAFWIDYSRPGESPRYNDPNVAADEGTSDVGADVLMPPPADSPAATEADTPTRTPGPGANPAPTEPESVKPSPVLPLPSPTPSALTPAPTASPPIVPASR